MSAIGYIGIAFVAVGVLMLWWALTLFVAHRHAERHIATVGACRQEREILELRARVERAEEAIRDIAKATDHGE